MQLSGPTREGPDGLAMRGLHGIHVEYLMCINVIQLLHNKYSIVAQLWDYGNLVVIKF